MVRKYQARLCRILLRVKTYNLLVQHYLSIRAKPISDIIVDVLGNIIDLSGKNFIVLARINYIIWQRGVVRSSLHA